MAQPPSPSPAQPDGSALCLDCGLCCAGLFAQVRLAPEDLPLARRSAAGIVERDGRPYAALPCSFLHDRMCGVYAERYAACRTFTCKLLRAFVGGDVAADTARVQIAEMRRRLADVRAAADAAGWSLPDFQAKVAAWRGSADKTARQSMARAQLALVACNLYADKHFRNVPDPQALA